MYCQFCNTKYLKIFINFFGNMLLAVHRHAAMTIKSKREANAPFTAQPSCHPTIIGRSSDTMKNEMKRNSQNRNENEKTIFPQFN